MTPHRAGHAAVIGGGMSGILAARALSDHFAEVTVIERDQLPDQPDFRKGVPQARHLHTFWAGGLGAAEQLLPGIEADLLAAGACPVRFPTDIRWLTPVDRWMGRFPATQRLASASRILIEWVVRRRVEQTPGIRFVAGHEVRSLRLDRRGDVSGLEVRRRGDGSVFELPADMVVDASGRGSSLPDWLEALDRNRPQESTVDAFLGYASRTYAIPDGFSADWKSTYIQASPPRDSRGGIVMPIEGNRWIVTLLGGGRDYPPTDNAGFMVHPEPAQQRPVRRDRRRGAHLAGLGLSPHLEPPPALRAPTRHAGTVAGDRRQPVHVQPALRTGHDRRGPASRNVDGVPAPAPA
jgi:flavin-dependent dehydrogenase